MLYYKNGDGVSLMTQRPCGLVLLNPFTEITGDSELMVDAKIVGAIRHMNDTMIIPWETLVRKVGNGSNVKFWLDEWVDNQPLKDRFNRLFYLESNKSCMINERLLSDSWRWEWRRHIRGGREQEQLQQLLDLLQNVELSDDMDRFSWSLDTSGDFLVSSTRAHIDDNTLTSGNFATRWSNYIPRKVNIFIWRLVLDKLPTRHNLSLRGLDLESLMCPICHWSVENTLHRFLGCDLAQEVWLKIARWGGLDWPSVTSLDDLFVWVDSHPNSRNQKRCLKSITYASLWILWRHRNTVLFKDKPVRRSEILCFLLIG
ncbi:RNA-directed DNA polymerase, eukaryota [Tanacetum coccineum]